MDIVKVKLKDPTTSFTDDGKTLKYREVITFKRSSKVNQAIKIGLLKVVQEDGENKQTEEKEEVKKTKSK
ncbi:MAG: hypothetical protein OHK0045_22770 [Raineya sp.]